MPRPKKSAIEEENIIDVEESDDTEWLQALELIDKLVVRATGKNLSEAQRIVLKGAWDQKTYKQISSRRYSMAQLRGTIAPGLWELLSSIFARRIGKTEVRDYFSQANLGNYQHLFQDLSVLGGHLPDTSTFYGRESDLLKLEKEILQQRLTILTGEAGIGKSLLAAKLISNISKHKEKKFDTLAWKPIVYGTSVECLVMDLFAILNLEIDSEILYVKISYLINQLRKQRCLIVLDGFENILQESKYRDEYLKFFRRLLEEGYGTCFLLTSRIAFKELQNLSNKHLVKHMQIFGLETDEAIQILKNKGVKNSEQAKDLIKTYRGNPSSIEELANQITHYFGGDIQKYLKYRSTMIGERLQTMLHQFFGQPGLLSSLQRSIMIYLANNLSAPEDSIEITTILDFFKEQIDEKVSSQDLFSALRDLEAKLLIEPTEENNYEICYKLQHGVKKYILNDPLGCVHKFTLKGNLNGERGAVA